MAMVRVIVLKTFGGVYGWNGGPGWNDGSTLQN